MSQVVPQQSDQIPLTETIRTYSEILVVKDLKKMELVKTVTFPIETHYKKEETTTYNEHASLMEVVEVIKATAPFKKKQIIKVWTRPAYDESMIRAAHEQGMSESPMEFYYAPHFNVTGNEFIVFLNKHNELKDVWDNPSLTREGLAAKPLIAKALHKKN